MNHMHSNKYGSKDDVEHKISEEECLRKQITKIKSMKLGPLWVVIGYLMSVIQY